MAQTLKFGNGTWATKKGSTLAYNDEDGNYKPLPFTYTGAGKGTRVNKQGLIEVVENDRPRIDYLDSEDGALLLEPTRSNLITYSEAFDNAAWTKSGASVVSGFVSPSGDTSAFKLVEDSISSSKSIKTSNFSVVNGQEYTISIFAKPNGRFLQITPSVAFVQSYINYDLNNGTMDLSGSGSASGTITLLSNGYYRCTYTAAANASSTIASIFSCLVNSISATRKPSYQGDGTSGVYIYGAQVEQGSYATSYIPTQGSVVTRVAETASGSGNSEVFNDSEGVLFADISPLADDGTFRMIGIFDSQTSNVDRIQIYYRNDADKMSFLIEENNVNQFVKTLDVNTTQYNKCAFQYGNTSSVYINGFKLAEETGITIPNNLQRLSFNEQNGGNDFYGKTKEISYYDTALTDLELETLTSYRSWLSMVNELNLNVIYNG